MQNMQKIWSLCRIYILHIYAKYAPGTLLMCLSRPEQEPGTCCVCRSRNLKHCDTVYNQVGAAPWSQGCKSPGGGKPPVAAPAQGKNMSILEPWYSSTSRAHGTVIMWDCSISSSSIVQLPPPSHRHCRQDTGIAIIFLWFWSSWPA